MSWESSLYDILQPIIRRLNRLETQEFPTPVSPFENTVVSAPEGTDLTLTGAWQDVPNCTLTLGVGKYLITASFNFYGGGKAWSQMIGGLNFNTVLQNALAQCSTFYVGAADQAERFTVTQQWIVTVPVAGSYVAKLQASEQAGDLFGNPYCIGAQTTITALKVAAS